MEHARHLTPVRSQRKIYTVTRRLCPAVAGAIILGRLAQLGGELNDRHWVSVCTWSATSNAPESPTARGFSAPTECGPFALPCDAHILCTSIDDLMLEPPGGTLTESEASTGEIDHAR